MLRGAHINRDGSVVSTLRLHVVLQPGQVRGTHRDVSGAHVGCVLEVGGQPDLRAVDGRPAPPL